MRCKYCGFEHVKQIGKKYVDKDEYHRVVTTIPDRVYYCKKCGEKWRK